MAAIVLSTSVCFVKGRLTPYCFISLGSSCQRYMLKTKTVGFGKLSIFLGICNTDKEHFVYLRTYYSS